MDGRSATVSIATCPAAFSPMVPTALSSYRSTTNPRRAACERKNSMWQEDSEATNASSGSTASSFDKGRGTTVGELEASTTAPPSNDHRWAREYRLSVNAAFAERSHTIVAT